MTDLTKDIFAEEPYGKAALAQFGEIPENFRLYKAGWLGSNPKEWRVMEVVGAEFQHAKRGKNVGKLSIKIEGSERTAYVTREDMQKFEEVK